MLFIAPSASACVQAADESGGGRELAPWRASVRVRTVQGWSRVRHRGDREPSRCTEWPGVLRTGVGGGGLVGGVGEQGVGGGGGVGVID